MDIDTTSVVNSPDNSPHKKRHRLMDSDQSDMNQPISNATSVVCVPTPNQHKPVAVQLVESTSNPAGVALVDAHRTTKCSDPLDLVELARQITAADDFVRARAHGRLGIIAEQMKHLQEQAKRVLSEAKRDDILHHAACNLVKRPGTVYYVYERPSGQHYISIISPNEWGTDCPHKFHAAYRLEADMSWTPAADISTRSTDIEFLDAVLHANKTLLSCIEDTASDDTDMN